MNSSTDINELAAALSKAQARFGTVKQSGKNPQFRSAYSTFDDVMDAVRKPLTSNGLSFSQMLDTQDGAPALTSILMHESGQYMQSTVPITAMESRVSSSGKKANNDVQVFGIAISYIKRYAITAMLGVGGEEDNDAADIPTLDDVEAQSLPDSHWIENNVTRKRFWAHWDSQGLSSDDVHAALDVNSVKGFTGSKEQAKAKIDHWVENKAILDEVIPDASGDIF